MKKALIFGMFILTLSACKKENNDPQNENSKGSIFATVFHYGDIIEGAIITTEPSSTEAKTDITGTAILSDVPIGGYKVNATHPNIGSGSASVTVTENEVMEVRINLIGGAFENPIVGITRPSDNTIFNVGEMIDFEGSISDSEDNPSEIKIEWSSNIDGVLSSNSADNNGVTTFSTDKLSEGEHTITLKATDSDGLVTTDEINIIIKKLPNAVTLNTIEVTTSGLILNWSTSDETEFTNYQITRSENESGPFEVIEIFSDRMNTSFTDENVIFGIRYFYQINVVLNNGDQSYSNIESNLFEGENIDLGVNIVRMKVDERRPYIYALDQINNSLLFINKETKEVEKTIFVGSSPSDLSINLSNTKMYVANFGSTLIAVIDLQTQEKVDDLTVDPNLGSWEGNPYRLACMGDDKLAYTSEDQWNSIKLINSNTGAFISGVGSIYMPGLLTSPDQTVLYVSESGSSGSQVIRFNLEGEELKQVDDSFSSSNSNRDSCISKDGTYIFYNRKKLLLNNLQSIVGSFSESIYACNFDGSIVIGNENIWNADNFSIIKALPVSSNIMSLDPDDTTLYIYDNNSSKIYLISIN